MIRVSNGPIRISRYADDRWGRPTKYWSVNDYGYIGYDMFQDIRFFESKPKPSERLYLSVVGHDVSSEEDFLRAAYKERMDRLRTTDRVYQFNAMRNPKDDSYIRMCAILCNDTPDKLQYCPPFDAYVKYPFYRAICRVANLVNSILGRLYGKPSEG